MCYKKLWWDGLLRVKAAPGNLVPCVVLSGVITLHLALLTDLLHRSPLLFQVLGLPGPCEQREGLKPRVYAAKISTPPPGDWPHTFVVLVFLHGPPVLCLLLGATALLFGFLWAMADKRGRSGQPWAWSREARLRWECMEKPDRLS